jgi:multiple sugar transport system permease protein
MSSTVGVEDRPKAGSTPPTGSAKTGPGKAPHGFRTFEFGMMAPAVVLLGLLSLVPFLLLIAMSFSKVTTLGGVKLTWIGLDNWIAVLGDSQVWASWGRSIVYFVSIIGIEMVLGLITALVLYQLVRGRSLVLSLILLPMFLAPVMVGLLFRFLLDSTIGFYAQVLQFLGITQDLLGSPLTALPTVVVIDMWQWTPLVTLILLAGLGSVPPSTLEAAAVDGAGYFKTLFRITLPQMRGVIVIALLVRSMDAIRYFDIITATTNGGPADSTKIVALKLYDFAFRFNNQMGKAAVLALTMLVFSIVLARIFLRLFSERDETTTGGGVR